MGEQRWWALVNESGWVFHSLRETRKGIIRMRDGPLSFDKSKWKPVRVRLVPVTSKKRKARG